MIFLVEYLQCGRVELGSPPSDGGSVPGGGMTGQVPEPVSEDYNRGSLRESLSGFAEIIPSPSEHNAHRVGEHSLITQSAALS